MEQEQEKKETEDTGSNEEEETSSNLNIVEQAQRVRDEIKAENDRREKILREEQKLRAEQMLAGTGGAVPPKEKKELTPREYKDGVEKGIIRGGQ